MHTLADGGGEGSNHWYKIMLPEGRNREVRRLFEALGLMVSRLIRTRYGVVAMPPQLKRGQTLELGPDELNKLMTAAGMLGGDTRASDPDEQPRHGHEADEDDMHEEEEIDGNRGTYGAREEPSAREIDGNREPGPGKPSPRPANPGRGRPHGHRVAGAPPGVPGVPGAVAAARWPETARRSRTSRRTRWARRARWRHDRRRRPRRRARRTARSARPARRRSAGWRRSGRWRRRSGRGRRSDRAAVSREVKR